MSKLIFVNLPVRDLQKSIAFYEAVGAVRNDDFADETAQMISFSDTIHAMLMTHEKFSSFTSRAICDARNAVQVLLTLSEDSRAAVDATTERALAAGGIEPSPIDDYDFMYGRSFEDPDGHQWGVMWMDAAAAKKAGAEPAGA